MDTFLVMAISISLTYLAEVLMTLPTLESNANLFNSGNNVFGVYLIKV